MIKEINCFSTDHGKPDDEDTATLFYNGKSTGKIINGCAIEKQFEVDKYYLIITSYGWACEECNYVMLLDKSFNLVSKKHIGGAYGSYSLEEAIPTNNNEIILRYSGDFGKKVRIKRIPYLSLNPYLRITNYGGNRKAKTRCKIIFALIYAVTFGLLFWLYPTEVALFTSIILIVGSAVIVYIFE